MKWELAAAEGGVGLTFSHFTVKRDFVVGLCAGWHCFLDNLEGRDGYLEHGHIARVGHQLLLAAQLDPDAAHTVDLLE